MYNTCCQVVTFNNLEIPGPGFHLQKYFLRE